MLLKKSRVFVILPLSLLLAGCPIEDHLKNKLKFQPPSNEGIRKGKTIIETTEISISCNKQTIEDYTSKGWKVISSSESEVPCTWKTVKATKGCNLKKDKGCKITVPDIIGKKTTYILEKETMLEDSSQKEALIEEDDSQ